MVSARFPCQTEDALGPPREARDDSRAVGERPAGDGKADPHPDRGRVDTELAPGRPLPRTRELDDPVVQRPRGHDPDRPGPADPSGMVGMPFGFFGPGSKPNRRCSRVRGASREDRLDARGRSGTGRPGDQDGVGRLADQHSHGHGFITTLTKPGVPLKTLMALARHSDPKLTMNVYNHLTIQDAAVALDALPDFSSPSPTPERLRATGTDPMCIPTSLLGGRFESGTGGRWRRRRKNPRDRGLS